MGIEPTYAAWEAAVLPLNYARIGERDRMLRYARLMPLFSTSMLAAESLAFQALFFAGRHTSSACRPEVVKSLRPAHAG